MKRYVDAHTAAVIAVREAIRPFGRQYNESDSRHGQRGALKELFISTYNEWAARKAQEAGQQEEGVDADPAAFLAVHALQKLHAALYSEHYGELGVQFHPQGVGLLAACDVESVIRVALQPEGQEPSQRDE